MNVGIVGCGLIGKKRAEALGDARLVACADTELARATALAARTGARASTSWRDVIAADDVELVIVATAHDTLAEITQAAAEEHEKHPARRGRKDKGAAAPAKAKRSRAVAASA